MEPAARFAVYSRKSRFTGKGESVENQVEMCRQYLRLHFGEEAAETALVYEDEGFSGGSLERPEFKRMMARAAEGGVRAVVVYRLDRISRSIGDFAGLIQRFNALGIGFISIKEQFDTASPMGRAMMYISSVFSQLERETIAERIRDNMRQLARTGRWLGGVTPTGFASESVSHVTADGKTRRLCRLTPIPEELDAVRLIFQKFLETGSLTATERYLLQNRYATKNGRPYTRFAIRGILANPVYLTADGAAYRYLTERHVELFSPREDFDGVHGVMAYNRTDQQRGAASKERPMEEWIVAVGQHPGAVPGAAWVKVQGLLEQNRSKCYRRPRSHTALLSGVLVCGGCGSFMRPKSSRRKDGGVSYVYLCSMKERGGSCGMKNCPGGALDGAVLEALKGLEEDRALFLRQLGRSALKESRDPSARLEAALAENEREIAELVSALAKASGAAAEGYILQKIEALHAEGEELRKRQSSAAPAPAGQERARLAQVLALLPDTVDVMTVEQRRAAIRALVERVVWDGETARVVLRGGDTPLCEDSK